MYSVEKRIVSFLEVLYCNCLGMKIVIELLKTQWLGLSLVDTSNSPPNVLHRFSRKGGSVGGCDHEENVHLITNRSWLGVWLDWSSISTPEIVDSLDAKWCKMVALRENFSVYLKWQLPIVNVLTEWRFCRGGGFPSRGAVALLA